MALRLMMPAYHIEAGNGRFNLNTPEEANRRLVGYIAEFNLVYTKHAGRPVLIESQEYCMINKPQCVLNLIPGNARLPIAWFDIRASDLI